MENKNYELGDRVQLKKEHPCGGNEWEIKRIGMDIKIKCGNCGRLLIMPRRKFEKNIKKLLY